MSAALAIGEFLVLWLGLWMLGLLVVALTFCIIEAPASLAQWWRARAASQKRTKNISATSKEMACIDIQAADAVERMGQAYLQAQALIRQEVRRREEP